QAEPVQGGHYPQTITEDPPYTRVRSGSGLLVASTPGTCGGWGRGDGQKGPMGVPACGVVEVPLALEQGDGVAVAVLHAERVGLVLERGGVEPGPRHPAGHRIGQALEDDLRAILMQKPVLQHLELQCAYRAQDRILLAEAALGEHLDRALLPELIEAPLQLLALERVLRAQA